MGGTALHIIDSFKIAMLVYDPREFSQCLFRQYQRRASAFCTSLRSTVCAVAANFAPKQGSRMTNSWRLSENSSALNLSLPQVAHSA